MQRIRAGLISIQQGKRRGKKESNWGLRWKLWFAPSRSGNSTSLVFKQPKILTEQRRLHIKRISGFLDSKCLNRNNRNHGSISGEGYISSSISGPPLSLALAVLRALSLCRIVWFIMNQIWTDLFLPLTTESIYFTLGWGSHCSFNSSLVNNELK